MRVLWVCNIMLPALARMLELPYSNREGWITGSFERLIRQPRGGGSAERLVELGVCCPMPKGQTEAHLAMDIETGHEIGSLDAPDREGRGVVDFFGFYEDLDHPETYHEELEFRFIDIIAKFQPDIVHIFGTEFPHTLAMIRAFGHPERTLIGIQGLCCSIANAYMADLPYKVQKRVTFRDWYRKDSLEMQQKKFMMRAKLEEEALRYTPHITGRTTFDRNVTKAMNKEAIYHAMNETMRPEFYDGQWHLENVEPYSIFLSQGDYPLKGFHYVLQAMPAIIEKFPNAHLYVAGNSIIGRVGGPVSGRKKYPEPLWITSYGKYLEQLIRKGRLKGHVTMLGRLDAKGMKERFLKSHVFVCPSIMENSPNSVCEAMLLGMPVVGAKVGGIGDLIDDGREGILFPGGNAKELTEGILAVFYDNELADNLGENARATARIRHNPDTNYMRLLEIYKSMV